ncbi:cohesin complex subunit [Malassezia equina]|uniref:Cohesin complex subunit n=1 Tax=Malassezia equina TaxID=1381935 RepID=A0AAF0EES8_9BASI|nr:cohesin complex subunit [Malassezia equina]
MARPRRSAAIAAHRALAGMNRLLTTEPSDSEEEDVAPPALPAKRGRQASAFDSDSSLSELSEEETPHPVPKRTRTKKSTVSAPDITETSDSELFQAVLTADGLDEAAENWVMAFQAEPSEALTDLIRFLLRLCGCSSDVDKEKVTDTEHLDEQVEALQDEVAQQAQAAYPIVSRAKNLRGVRKHAARLVEKLLSDAAEADILGEEDFLDVWQQWLVALSISSLRSFRHTASVVSLWTVGALSAQLQQTREQYDVTVRQRDAEAQRSGSNRTRLAHTADKMEQLDALRDTLDATLDTLVNQVFSPRSRDFDAAIRLDCMEQLGTWMKSFPTQYLQSFYFRHIGTALSDPDVHVRLQALRAVQGVSTPEQAIQLVPLAEAHKARMVEMALYDIDLAVRTTAFSVLECFNEQEMLSNDDRAALAVHVFDLETRIRLAAASFLSGLLEHKVASMGESGQGSDAHVRIQCLASLLVQYDHTLEHDTEPLDAVDLAMVQPGLGRKSMALEALWETNDALHTWQPYLDVLMDETQLELTAEEESAVVELFAMTVRLVKEHDEEAWSACSAALVDALPKLLSKYAADAPRMADLLQIVPYMDLEVYHETRDMAAFESLWEDLCGYFNRHMEPGVLQHAAQAIHLLAAAPAAVTTATSRLLSLKESVLSRLQDTLHQRQIATTVFSEDDVHNLQASLARLHALLKVMDASPLLEDETLWESILALARRGRLDYTNELPFVRLALESLALDVLWRTKEAMDTSGSMHAVIERRDAVVEVACMFLEQETQAQSAAVQVCLLLYTLFGTMQDSDVQLLCPPNVQKQCASVVGRALHDMVEPFHEHNAPRGRKQTRASVPPALLAKDLHLISLTSTLVAAIRAGTLHVSHAASILAHYAWLSADFDALCHELLTVMRDDALHAERAWAVCETVLEALKGSFALVQHYGDEVSETHFLALARQLANTTMIRGSGFSVVQAVDAKAMVTLHVAAVQQVIQYWQAAGDTATSVLVFFKGMAQLLGTLTPVDAMKIHSTLHKRFAAANIDPVPGAKEWDPYHNYEKRLLHVAAKDPSLVQEAAQYNVPT